MKNYEKQPRVTQNAIFNITRAHYFLSPRLTVKLLSYWVK